MFPRHFQHRAYFPARLRMNISDSRGHRTSPSRHDLGTSVNILLITLGCTLQSPTGPQGLLKLLRESSGTPQGVLKIPANFSQSPHKVPEKVQGLIEDSSGTPQGLFKDLSEIDKDPTRTSYEFNILT
jgi:hypothetical protein